MWKQVLLSCDPWSSLGLSLGQGSCPQTRKGALTRTMQADRYLSPKLQTPGCEEVTFYS